MDRPDSADTDDDVARVLRAAGVRQQLPDELKDRWEAHFRGALQARLAARHRRRGLWSLCAGLAVAGAALLAMHFMWQSDSATLAVRFASGQSSLQVDGQAAVTLAAGRRLAPGSVILTGPDGYVALSLDGYDLRLNHDTLIRYESDRILLERGELYASDYPGGQPASALRVATALAVITDIGTQFTVAARPDRTVTTVRRGALLIDTGAAALRSEAGAGSASRLTIDQRHGVRRETVAPSGEHWRWIYARDTGFSLEGSSVYEFLVWSVGESGLRLAFVTPDAESHARITRLHGSLGGLDPERAVPAVLAGTDLEASVATEDHTLRVRLRR